MADPRQIGINKYTGDELLLFGFKVAMSPGGCVMPLSPLGSYVRLGVSSPFFQFAVGRGARCGEVTLCLEWNGFWWNYCAWNAG